MITARHRPRVAIVGTGLSGSILAHLLHPVCKLTLLERGEKTHARAADFAYRGHWPGMRPFAYGLGGTTNLWTGGLVELLPSEFTTGWPERVRDDLPQFYQAVVSQLYGPAAGQAWPMRIYRPLSSEAHLTSIYYPHHVFRVVESSLLAGCEVRHSCRLRELQEVAQGVEVSFEQDQTSCTETFDLVIVACGGMNSPVLLQRSGLGGSLVGQNFTDHPTGFVAKISDAKNQELFNILRAGTFGLDASKAFMKVRDQQTGLWSALYLRPAANLSFKSDPYTSWFARTDVSSKARRYYLALRQLSNPDVLYRVVENRFGWSLPSRCAYVHVINEQEDTGQGSVATNAEGIPTLDWQVSETTTAAIQRNLKTFAGQLGAQLHLPHEPMQKRLFSGAHLSGTCRMATDPTQGVVDEDLLVYGTQRIYVCDGSVLPSTGATNTGLTIGALGHRLVNHLTTQVF